MRAARESSYSFTRFPQWNVTVFQTNKNKWRIVNKGPLLEDFLGRRGDAAVAVLTGPLKSTLTVKLPEEPERTFATPASSRLINLLLLSRTLLSGHVAWATIDRKTRRKISICPPQNKFTIASKSCCLFVLGGPRGSSKRWKKLLRSSGTSTASPLQNERLFSRNGTRYITDPF